MRFAVWGGWGGSWLTEDFAEGYCDEDEEDDGQGGTNQEQIYSEVRVFQKIGSSVASLRLKAEFICFERAGKIRKDHEIGES